MQEIHPRSSSAKVLNGQLFMGKCDCWWRFFITHANVRIPRLPDIPKQSHTIVQTAFTPIATDPSCLVAWSVASQAVTVGADQTNGSFTIGQTSVKLTLTAKIHFGRCESKRRCISHLLNPNNRLDIFSSLCLD